MKLLTENGQLDLPKDFSLTMERTNPLMSDQGDASAPATLPASSHNMATLGHLERIDRARRYVNKMDAILQVGPVQKRGSLVIDTVSREGGIEASLAIDSSDLYAKAKDKTLKEIYQEAQKKVAFNGVAAAMDYMQDIFEGDDTYDYTIFPVAIAAYEENNATIYQYNNEVYYDNNLPVLRSEARNVREGDVLMAVPEGYGIAPFLKLHALLRTLFECLGYTVTENCFATGDMANITIVHNCSDCLVTGTLYYEDMAPSCKLSDLLEWLLAKFHAQPVVDSETKTVKIVLMETLLNSTPDIDLSSIVEGGLKMQLNPQSRIVLTPTNDIEGTAPAAETFDKLIAKYGGYVEADEDQFSSLTGGSPAFYDCLVLRKATGQFYALNRNMATGAQTIDLIGTNHFPYDRNNSDSTEGFSQEDTMPLMLCDIVKTGCREVAPFIGERIHFHTSYQDKEEKAEQKIIVVQRVYDRQLYYYTSGTTQKYVPYPLATGGGITLTLGLTNHEMYATFWQKYNELILNYPAHVSGRVKYGLGQFLGLDMSSAKLFKGQRLLPIKATAALGDKMGLTDAEFILQKTFADGVSDTAITPMASNSLRWELHFTDENTLPATAWDEVIYNWQIDNHVTSEDDQMTDYSAVITDMSSSVYLGIPAFEGQITAQATHTIAITVTGVVKYYNGDHELVEATVTGTVSYSRTAWYIAVAV